MDKNKAVVWVAGLFTYGMVALTRMIYLEGARNPLVNVNKPVS